MQMFGQKKQDFFQYPVRNEYLTAVIAVRCIRQGIMKFICAYETKAAVCKGIVAFGSDNAAFAAMYIYYHIEESSVPYFIILIYAPLMNYTCFFHFHHQY